MPHACKHRIPSSSSAMPRGSTFTHSSLSRTIFRTWCRARSPESIAPVGPHPQMTTSVVSLSGCEDMKKSRGGNTLRQLIWFDEWQKSVKRITVSFGDLGFSCQTFVYQLNCVRCLYTRSMQLRCGAALSNMIAMEVNTRL